MFLKFSVLLALALVAAMAAEETQKVKEINVCTKKAKENTKVQIELTTVKRNTGSHVVYSKCDTKATVEIEKDKQNKVIKGDNLDGCKQWDIKAWGVLARDLSDKTKVEVEKVAIKSSNKHYEICYLTDAEDQGYRCYKGTKDEYECSAAATMAPSAAVALVTAAAAMRSLFSA